MRPKSIIRFEQLFFLNLVLGLIVTLVTWNTRMEAYHAQPGSEAMGDIFPMIMLVVGWGISLALWFFIARQASSIAKWIYVVLFGFGVIGTLIGLAMGTATDTITLITSVVSLIISAAAVYFLFQPDANLWFSGEKPADPTQTFQ